MYNFFGEVINVLSIIEAILGPALNLICRHGCAGHTGSRPSVICSSCLTADTYNTFEYFF